MHCLENWQECSSQHGVACVMRENAMVVRHHTHPLLDITSSEASTSSGPALAMTY